jgi:hypothetical protein
MEMAQDTPQHMLVITAVTPIADMEEDLTT